MASATTVTPYIALVFAILGAAWPILKRIRVTISPKSPGQDPLEIINPEVLKAVVEVNRRDLELAKEEPPPLRILRSQSARGSML
jgi:hypothetical protein